ncbi:MAG: hypothetical protein IPF38_15505, partial [Burkholderiales bacterium]|nr:hypothetical protein [Burkholderiales bacterium]
MAGFLDATAARLQHLPASDRPTVVIPSYNGARKLPPLTPLLALLLAREGLPVLDPRHGHRIDLGFYVRSARSPWYTCASSY